MSSQTCCEQDESWGFTCRSTLFLSCISSSSSKWPRSNLSPAFNSGQTYNNERCIAHSFEVPWTLRVAFRAALSPGLATNIQQCMTQPPQLCSHLFPHKVLLLLTRSKSPAGSYPATQECIPRCKDRLSLWEISTKQKRILKKKKKKSKPYAL